MSRGGRREAILYDDANRVEFLRTLGQACLKSGWLRIGSASYVSNLLSSIDLLKLRFLRPLVRTGALPANQAQPVVHPQTGSLLYARS